ncbi:MAG: PhoH family protein [Desulfovibrio sp.]|jgi:phosphate starvation-inducible PhoH-like protein|nr:PhoH family protein [Desulfovibrio sp.]
MSENKASMAAPEDNVHFAEQSLDFADTAFARELFGPRNANLDTLARRSGLHIAACGSRVTLKGEAKACDLTRNLLLQIYDLMHAGLRLNPQDLPHAYAVLEKKPEFALDSLYGETIFSSGSRRSIVARTLSQREYTTSLLNSDMTFAVGPAGTGKTYLAVAAALSLLLSKKVRRIILTRPAVEAGERLGFLPGDLAEKVNPYLRPLYDAMHDMLDPEKTAEMIASGVIEIAPLGFMRGRTLNDAFIILDEAQNTTPEQMKMFVTRLGLGSRAAVTGDITQIDLPRGPDGARSSGLVQVLRILHGVEGINVIYFHKDDVIRHPLVARIIDAYESYQTNSG